MGRIGLAFRVFFRVLFDAVVAERVRAALAGTSAPAPTKQVEEKPAPRETPVKHTPPPPPKPSRSEALSLLAALQREARLVDFVQEPIAGYSDAQIGAAVRDVHRGCADVIERLFALKPVLDQQEGATVDVPAGFDAARFHLTGNVVGQAPYKGALVHHGWEATRCEVPEWTGGNSAARVVAPAEVELR